MIARAAVLLGLAVLLAYHTTFSAPFVADDLPGIVRNSSLRQLWPLDEVLLPSPVAEMSRAAFPLVNLSLALNYALSGLDVTGYHVVNLLIHLSAAILLFAIVRRTFTAPRLQDRFGAAAFPLALAIALIWALHPLQSAAVTPVIQRAELMAGVFLLLTLYAFIRATAFEGLSWRWSIVAFTACLAGMATSETMASAPIIVLLYDRTFVAGSWRAVVQRHAKLHFAFIASWSLLTFLLSRNGPADFAGKTGWMTVLSQCDAAMKSLALSFWPEPLVFDYGMGLTRGPSGIVSLITVVALALATVVLFGWRPIVGFLAAAFLVALLPGITAGAAAASAMAEHRMYVALAAPIILVATAAWTRGGRIGLIAMFGIVLVCGALTFRRNLDYASALILWRDTVAKVPENPRAHYNLANALSAAGRAADAVTHYQTALRLEPRYAAAHHNLGGTLLQLQRAEEAVVHYRSALQIAPDSVDTQLNLAAALVRLGRMSEAVTYYETASRAGLLAAEEQLRFGRALAEVGRIDEALVRLLKAVRLNPHHAETRVVTGMVLSAAGRTSEALQHFTAAVVADPKDAEARAALADLLIESSRPAEALVHYEAALKLQPGQAATYHVGMGHALIRLARADEAIFHYESALQLNPDNQEARAGLKRVQTALQRRGLLKN